MHTQLLLLTLRGLGSVTASLRSILQCPADRLYVYYACPLSNLRNIAATGILPNARAPQNRTDLSGQGVQAKRDIEVAFPGWQHANAHECVTLFWNPLNGTLRAFQRNGLLREASSKNPDDAVVCLLEIDLERLLLYPTCKWVIAPQNFAATTRFATFSRDYIAGTATWPDGTPRCDWQTIFSIESPKDRALDWRAQDVLNKKRSAELIIHLGDGDESGPASSALPFELVERILVPADEVRALTEDQNTFLDSIGKPITRLSTVNGTPVYFRRNDLLKPELQFLRSLQERRMVDPGAWDRVNAALESLQKFEANHPDLSPNRERFVCPELADDRHGSLHAARVMFWCAFLVHHLDEAVLNELLPVVLAAAAVHDTYRESTQEDQTHGRAAAGAHQETIARVLTNPQSLASCLSAITHHCVPDQQCPMQDTALQVLKDADALDRGRFGAPDKPRGCDTKYFRTETLRLRDVRRNIAWMAFWAAQGTRHTLFGSTPCAEFVRSFCDAVNSLASKPRA